MKNLILLLFVLGLTRLTSYAQSAPDWMRVLQINTNGLPSINVLTADATCAYAAGVISGPITFDGINYTSVGLNDLILLKASQSGVTEWVKQINAQAGGTISPDAIKVDASGNIFFSATFSGSLTIGGNTITSSTLYNAFFAKFDNSGTGLWATPFLSTGTGSSKIAFDNNGNSYLISKTTKLLKFSGSGSSLWEQSFPDKTLQAIAVFDSNLYLGGTLQTTTNFGTITLNKLGGYNTGFLVRANLDGVYNNSIVVGGSITGDGSSVSDIVTDNTGNLIITGSYTRDLVLGGITLTNIATAYYTYIAKCNANFVFSWAKSSTKFVPGTTYLARQMSNYRIFLDNSNNIYEFGIIDNSFSFGAVNLSITTGNQFLIKFDPNGNATNGYVLENASYGRTYVSPSGKILIGGAYNTAGSLSYGNFYINLFDNSMIQVWQKVSSNSKAGIAKMNYIKQDAAGNSYIQSRIIGYCDYFGTIINTNSYITVISKHDISGNLIWMNQIADISPTLMGSAFILDKDANVLTLGIFKTSLNIGNITLNSSNTGNEGYVAKYSSGGTFLWAAKMDLAANISTNISLASDALGNVIVAGVIRPANYLVKFDPSGHRLWAKSFPMESSYISLVSSDASNNIYLTSEIHLSNATGTTTIGSVILTQTYNDGATALVKFDPDGNALWAKTYGGVSGSLYSDGWPCDIRTDSSGNTFLWGWCNNKAIFGSTTLTNPFANNNDYSYFLTKINTTGDVIWAKAIYEIKYGYNYGDLLDLDKYGNVYVGGHFIDKISIEGSEYSPEGTNDFFTVKYSGAGAFEWIKTIPSNTSIINSLSVYNEDNVSVVGNTGKNSTLGNFNIIKKGGSNCLLATMVILDPTPNPLRIGATAGSANSFAIFAPNGWTAACDKDWLILGSTSGTGNAVLSFTALANPTNTARTAKITITISGANTIIQTITIIQDAGTNGISDILKNEPFIFPNPTSDFLYFKSDMKDVTVFVIDLNGKVQINESIKDNMIDVSKIESGVYFLKLIDNSQVLTTKFIKR